MNRPATAQARCPGRPPGRTRAAVVATAVTAMLAAGCSTGAEEGPEERPGPTAPSRPESRPPTGPPEKEPVPFAPYVDTMLGPPYDLTASASRTGVREYTLAFVSPGRGCTPMWGGRQELPANRVARQVGKLRAAGGEVRVSFGGQSGNELARSCRSVDALVAAYGKVIDAYDLTRVDFDIEGPALTDTRATDRRARALVRLQREHPDLDVSFTLPVMPHGLNRHARAVLSRTSAAGVRVSTVNIMAMDFGTYYDGDMGEYAVKAAEATQKQIKPLLGIRDDAQAWGTLSVTPMIGVNDVEVEVFRVEDAVELREFAEDKGLGGLSMWSVTRDKPCPRGTGTQVRATCSSTATPADAFMEAFTG
jgi:hypothetical protein